MYINIYCISYGYKVQKLSQSREIFCIIVTITNIQMINV